MINQDSWEWLAIFPGGIKAMTSKWSSMFINHLLNGMILQVPKTYPCLSRFGEGAYIGHASSLPVTRDPHLSPGWSKAWLISCPAFAIMPSKELSVEFLWQTMTICILHCSWWFSQFESQQIEDPFNFRWVGWIYIHDKAWYYIITYN